MSGREKSSHAAANLSRKARIRLLEGRAGELGVPRRAASELAAHERDGRDALPDGLREELRPLIEAFYAAGEGDVGREAPPLKLEAARGKLAREAALHGGEGGVLRPAGPPDIALVPAEAPRAVEDQLEGLVHFVNFADSTAAAPPTPAVMGMDLSMALNISEAAHFRCELSDDKSSYVDIEGGGTLNFRLNQQGDMRLTGRFTAGSGEMKYALPVIPLKTFQLVEGSYIDFLGDMMNPTLNIAAKERVKATVTENDAPRSVNFDVGIAITKPLDQMGLEFTIEAPEDLSVQNQLAAMTPEQRGKTAVTMLATGMFITDEGGTSGSGFKANDALNAFLQSEIQNIAGSALRTIDINLGVESGTSATGTEQTDYSFQFAKRFWDNRISIIIGGKVSTGADAENSAESFIDNVSIEYRLDKSSTRHVKVFYDRNTNDPLEGQLTKTGAGLVLRRKSNRLGELFIFRTPKPKKAPEATTTK